MLQKKINNLDNKFYYFDLIVVNSFYLDILINDLVSFYGLNNQEKQFLVDFFVIFLIIIISFFNLIMTYIYWYIEFLKIIEFKYCI